MAHNYYSELNYHINWHAKENMPLITHAAEPFIHRYLKQKVINTPGAFIHEIGGTETHVHLAVTLTPTILISEFIGVLKGSSSHEINQQLGRGDKIIQWQSGYGVVSFGTGDLDWVKEYVRNQKEHHAKNTLHDRLERIDHPEPRLA